MRNRLIYILFLCAPACMPQQSLKEQNGHLYFDLKGLMDEQALQLDSIDPSFVKTVIVDDREEIYSGSSSADSWAGDLQLFHDYDLNRPTLTDKYLITQTEDSASIQINYVSKEPNTTRVDSLSISLDKPTKKPFRIELLAHSANSLFESSQQASLHFSAIDDLVIINSYHIEGWQRLLSQKASHYTISTRLEIP